MDHKKAFGIGKIIPILCVSALMVGCSRSGAVISDGAGDSVSASAATFNESSSSDASEKLGLIDLRAAEKAALDHAGIEENAAEVIGAKLEQDNGVMKYDIEFVTETEKYDYDINATDGKVISFTMEKLPSDDSSGSIADNTVAPSQNINSQSMVSEPTVSEKSQPSDTVVQSAPQISQSTPQIGQPTLTADSSTAAAPVNNPPAALSVISEAEAKSAALRHAGVSEADTAFKKSRLEYDDGIQIYDIEFTTSVAEYEYEIRASDGYVIEFSAERFDIPINNGHHYENHGDHNYHHNGNCISEDDARHACLEHLGFSSDNVSFIKTEFDSDDTEYEVEFTANGIKYEVKVNALTGAVLEVDTDD